MGHALYISCWPPQRRMKQNMVDVLALWWCQRPQRVPTSQGPQTRPVIIMVCVLLTTPYLRSVDVYHNERRWGVPTDEKKYIWSMVYLNFLNGPVPGMYSTAYIYMSAWLHPKYDHDLRRLDIDVCNIAKKRFTTKTTVSTLGQRRKKLAHFHKINKIKLTSTPFCWDTWRFAWDVFEPICVILVVRH